MTMSPSTTMLHRGPQTLLALACVCLLACTSSTGTLRKDTDARRQKSATRSEYADELVRKAHWLGLGDDDGWLRLGHYRATPIDPRPVSEIDGRDFFLSPRGKSDPRAELDATLRAFFAPAPDIREHPICLYPARFEFLRQHLQINLAHLQMPACSKFAKFVTEANPSGVFLVFSSYYLNNPASALGHTYLRLQKAGNLAIGDKAELLDYAIEYSADVDTGNAIIYALKGLLGAFPGTVKRMPQYYKVREYNDYESRDMWEYELAMNASEQYMLLAHIWELGHTHFDYYYLSENCSYRIMLLLEAAKPSLHLADQLGSPVLPADTVKALFRNRDLVKQVRYRPSLRTRFEHDIEGLDSEQRALVDALADDAELALPRTLGVSRSVQVLDAAADLVDIRSIKNIVDHTDDVAAERKRRLLERRAAIHVQSQVPPLEPPWEKAAERGHDSKRLGLAPGLRIDGRDEGFLTIDFRLAMHDLADPADGYPDVAQIEFLPTRLRVYPRRSGPHFALDDFSLVQIVSLNPISRFDLHPSWRLSVGARTLEDNGCSECTVGKFRLGAGPTMAFAERSVVMFLMADTLVYASGALSGIAKGPVRAGLGPAGGVRLRLDPDLIWLSQGEVFFYPTQRDPLVWQVDSVLRFSYVHNQALSLELRALHDRQEAMLFALSYF
jgi:hypothetical protein